MVDDVLKKELALLRGPQRRAGEQILQRLTNLALLGFGKREREVPGLRIPRTWLGPDHKYSIVLIRCEGSQSNQISYLEKEHCSEPCQPFCAARLVLSLRKCPGACDLSGWAVVSTEMPAYRCAKRSERK